MVGGAQTRYKDSGVLHAQGGSSNNGRYAAGAGNFPASAGGNNYWVDVTFSATPPQATVNYVWDVAGGLPRLLSDGSKTYVYGDRLLYTADGSGAGQAGTPTWLFGDKLGSTAVLMNAQGNITGTYTYDVFGAVRTQTGVATEISFTGEQNDPNGLEFLRARYYDPSTGRFLSRDPMGDAYRYAGNNPTNLVDPSGLFADGAWSGFDTSSPGSGYAWSGMTPDGMVGTPSPDGVGLLVGHIAADGSNAWEFLAINVVVDVVAHGKGNDPSFFEKVGGTVGALSQLPGGQIVGAAGGRAIGEIARLQDDDTLFTLHVDVTAYLPFGGGPPIFFGTAISTVGNYNGLGFVAWHKDGEPMTGVSPLSSSTYVVTASFHSWTVAGLTAPVTTATVTVAIPFGGTAHYQVAYAATGPIGGAIKVTGSCTGPSPPC